METKISRSCRAALAFAGTLLLAACNQPVSSPSGGAFSAPSNVSAAPSLPAISAPAPRYADALSGLYTMPATAVPLDVAVNYYAPSARSGSRAVLTMALVPGANYGRLRAYHAQAARDSGGAGADDLQTQPVLARAVDILKERYPWLELMDDVATAQERNVSLTVVLDIRSVLAEKPGDPTTVQIEVVVFNEKRQPVSRIVTAGSAATGGVNAYGFQTAAGQALDGLAAKSKTYFN